MSLRYVCGIIKDHFGRYLVLDYTPEPDVSGYIVSQNRCTLSIESWVEDNEDTLDVVVREINDVLHVPTLSVLSSLELCDTKTLSRPGQYADQEVTVYTFLIQGPFMTKCNIGIEQYFMTADQLMEKIRKKVFSPTVYASFVISRLHLWELVA